MQCVPRLDSAWHQGLEAIPSQQLWIPFANLHMFLSFHGSRSIHGRISRPAMAPARASAGPYRPSKSLIISHTQFAASQTLCTSKFQEDTKLPSIADDFFGCSTPTWDELRCCKWSASRVGGEEILGAAPWEPTWLGIKEKGSALLA